MSLRTVKLPARTIMSHKTIDKSPEDSDLTLLGALVIKSEENMDLPMKDARGKETTRRVSDSYYLLVWRDNISKKIFWWEGRRHNAYMLTLFDHEYTYNSWPCQLFEVKSRDKAHIKQFINYIKAWGLTHVIAADNAEKLKAQKRKLINSLIESVGKKRNREE